MPYGAKHYFFSIYFAKICCRKGYIFNENSKLCGHFQGMISSALLWLASVAAGLAVVIGVYPMWTDGYTNFASTCYAMFMRVGWSLALAWTVFACTKGYGGIINSFLSWGFFTVLGRLTFLSYLIHLEIIPIILCSFTYSFELNTFQIVSIQHELSVWLTLSIFYPN